MKLAYQDKKTPVHRLHPVCKIIWVLAVLAGSILINDPILLVLLFISTIPFVIIGKIVKEWGSFVKLALWLSIFIAIINMLASQHGSHILYSSPMLPILGTINITLESIIFSIGMSIRLLATISAFAILTLTINPDDLLQTILLLKIPYRTVLTTSIAIRFIPCLFTDLDTLQSSLQTRGYQMAEGGFLTRIKRRAIIIPSLLSNSLERSIQSAEAMESRGFGSKGRKTFYNVIQTTRTDYFFIALSLSLFALFAIMWILRIGTYEYYPNITPIVITISYVSVALFLVLSAASPAILSPLKKVIDLD